MEESELVGHLCTPRYYPTSTTATTTTNNNNNHTIIHDHYFGRPRSKRRRSKKLTRSKSQHDISGRADNPLSQNPSTINTTTTNTTNPITNPELSVDNRAPGLLKIFGGSVVAGTQYKSVLASTRSTAQELIKQALERYGIAARLYKDFVLCESVGRTVTAADSQDQEGWTGQFTDRGHKKLSKDKNKKTVLSSSPSPSLFLSWSSNFIVNNSNNHHNSGNNNNNNNNNNNLNHHHHSLHYSAVSSSKDCVSFSSSPRLDANPNTPRSARSLGLRSKKSKKFWQGDKSPCGTPRVTCADSPRTPLGSPRTPCGSPSTSRGSPRTSVICHNNNNNNNAGRTVQEDLDLVNYRPPKVWDGGALVNHHQQQHHNHHLNQPNHRGISKSDKNRFVDSLRSNHNNYNSNSAHNTPRLIDANASDNVHSPRQDGTASHPNNVSPHAHGDWIQVYFRVLCYSDRPLELQEFWKPPEGLSRRYELKRRRDVVMDAMESETTGLNENARRIMISKILPGVIPISGGDADKAPEVRTSLRDEWNRAASALTNASLTYTDENEGLLTSIVDGDSRQAYVCPSIYPYLLTLRGCSIQKDLVLYPLRSRSLSIGSAEKKPPQSDDIKLTSPDVNPAHCRVTLKRLPQDEKSVEESSKRIYWYCLDLEILGNSFVTVNGIQVRQKATVFPGDLLGIGRQYLFLYKDPTGGHDIPSAVPWLPENETEASAIYSQVIRHQHQNESRDYSTQQQQARSHDVNSSHHTLDIPAYHEEDSNVLDDSAARETAIFLAYHRDKEMELLECIAEVECHAKGDYPLSQAVLFLASHQYAARKFSGNHQATFFKRLVRVVRARVGVVSKLVSQQKHESRIFSSDNSSKKPSSSEVDYFPCLVNWLSTVLTLLGHCRTSQFQTYVSSLARRNDVIKSVQEAVGYFEETVSFLFQQVVYSVTKVLYDPINKFIQGALPEAPQPSSSSSDALRRILHVMQAVRRSVQDLLVNSGVANQLLVYLMFFVSTTLFNRIIAKGSRLYNRDSGSMLQEGVGALEAWAKGSDLEQDFVRVSEHILSLVDLLSSSKRTLLRLDWQSFQTQFSPLSDLQLSKVLGEYDVGDGVTAPVAWQPAYPVDPKQGELTVSLSSHPPFVLPKQGGQVNLQDTFPAAFYRHLEQVQQRFSLVGEDAYYSGLSSAGNTPRLSEPANRSANLDTFFSQDPNSSMSSHARGPHHDLKPQVIQLKQPVINGDNHIHHPQNQPPQTSTKRVPPQTAPKPKRTQPVFQENETSSTANQNRTVAPPPYNMAIKLKQSQTHENPNKTHNNDTTDSTNRQVTTNSSRNRPILHRQSSTDKNPHDSKPKSNPNIQSNLQNFQTLPDNLKDKLFTSQNTSSTSHTSSNPHSHLNRSGSSAGKPSLSSHRLKTQQSWSPASNHPVTSHQHNHLLNTSDMSSTYPGTRPRPSSATDMQHSLEHSNNMDNSSDSTSGPFMSNHQRAELLSTRSNSALGYDMIKAAHNNQHIDEDRRRQQHTRLTRQDSGNTQHTRSARDLRENILQPHNYEHIKDSSIVVTQHVSPYNYTPHAENNSNPSHTTHHEHMASSQTKDNNGGLFSYGSLKRSPRNTNLSKRTPSENKINDTTTSDKRVLIKSGHDNNSASGDPDVPPPLPPRGENIRRQPSVESQTRRDNSRDRQNRESPLGSALSSSGSRPRAGSRTSVEIQDITENQYIIYNPDSPVKEFFDFNQNYLSMANRNHNSHHPENTQVQGIPNPHNALNPESSTRKLTRVPPLELPDDLLGGVSENDSQDEVFNGHLGLSDNGHRGGGGRRMSSVDDYPDDVYIDVNDLSNSDSTASSNLKVLPVSDEGRRPVNGDSSNGPVFVRYRHSMPGSHDVIDQQGEITGEVFTVTLTKGSSNKLGMGLIDGMHTPLKLSGIYIRNVLPDTPAALCGCLRVGDRILSVNNNTIVGMHYNSVMKMIHSTGPSLELTVSKGDRSIASKISASTA